MRILVTSDSHRNTLALKRAVNAAKPFDAFIFLGDGEDDYNEVTMSLAGIDTYAVRGNNDYYSMLAQTAAVEIGGQRFLLTHGHKYAYGGLMGGGTLASAAKQNDCRIALFGHTHCRYFSEEDGVYLFNPGSVSLPRDGQPPSYGIITIENGKPDFFHFDLKKGISV